jgi:hypothetical protein
LHGLHSIRPFPAAHHTDDRHQYRTDPYLDFAALTRDQAAALQEVTIEDYVDGRGDNARE